MRVFSQRLPRLFFDHFAARGFRISVESFDEHDVRGTRPPSALRGRVARTCAADSARDPHPPHHSPCRLADPARDAVRGVAREGRRVAPRALLLLPPDRCPSVRRHGTHTSLPSARHKHPHPPVAPTRPRPRYRILRARSYALLWREGGVYLDTDVLLTKPLRLGDALSSAHSNALGIEELLDGDATCAAAACQPSAHSRRSRRSRRSPRPERPPLPLSSPESPSPADRRPRLLLAPSCPGVRCSTAPS